MLQTVAKIDSCDSVFIVCIKFLKKDSFDSQMRAIDFLCLVNADLRNVPVQTLICVLC